MEDNPEEIKTIDDSKELKEFVAEMPPVVQDAVDAAHAKEAEVKEVQQTAVDRKGNAFDPNIHAVDEKTGQPLLTPKTGRFKRKLNIPKQTPAAGSTAPSGQPVDPIRQEATEWAMMFVMGAMTLIGDEAKPREGEMEALISGYEGIFRKYGVMQIGVEAKLLVVHFSYIASRANQPKTRSVLTKVKDFFTNIALKVQGKNYKVVTEDKK